MASLFIEGLDGKPINISLIQTVYLDPEDNKNVVFQFINGEIFKEELDSESSATDRLTDIIKELESDEGGGVTPTGTLSITENGNYNVIQYANANVNIDKNVKMTTQMTTDKSKVHNNIITIPAIDMTGITQMIQMFRGYSSLIAIPALTNAGSVTDMRQCFDMCESLVDLPIFDTSSVTTFQNAYTRCYSLSNESLDNILQMCINSSIATANKKLSALNLPSSITDERIEALPHYQDFLDAGWTLR